VVAYLSTCHFSFLTSSIQIDGRQSSLPNLNPCHATGELGLWIRSEAVARRFFAVSGPGVFLSDRPHLMRAVG